MGAFVAKTKQPSVALARIYAQYRTGKLSDALKALAAVPTSSRTESLTHLEAQSLFKSGAFARAATIYDALLTPETSTDPEYVVNCMAAHVAAGNGSRALQLQKNANDAVLENPDVWFNASLAAASESDWARATEHLAQARKLHIEMARARLEADAEEDADADIDVKNDPELQSELALLTVQEAFVAQRLAAGAGATALTERERDALKERAKALYAEALAPKAGVTPNAHVVAVATNNSVVARGVQDRPGEALKKLEHALEMAKDKLSPQQVAALQVNICLLLAHSRRIPEFKDALKKLESSQAGANLDPEFGVLVRAYVAVKEKQYQQAEDLLKEYVTAHPDTSINSQLALVHLPLLRDNVPAALAALDAFLAPTSAAAKKYPDLKFRPAVTALRVALHERAGNVAAAAAELDAAMAHWMQKEKASKGAEAEAASNIVHVMRVQGADLKLRNGQLADAVALLESLAARELQSGNTEKYQQYTAKMVVALADSDPARATALAAKLPAAEALVGLSASAVDALEAEGVPGALSISHANVSAAAAMSTSTSTSTSASAQRGDEDEEGDSKTSGAEFEEKKAHVVTGPALRKDGKKVFSPEKLKQVRERKRARRKHRYPTGMDRAASEASIAAGTGPDPYRWKPKWERPGQKKQKGGRPNQQFRGPQGSGISENKVESTTLAKVAPVQHDLGKVARSKARRK